ncbi:MAG: hypothetical protein H6631_03185 [Anaerolineaceae bacterium]|nr:hypothetical protein [Anaerolineaceae bacterium]MCB9099699.1 hypothetical protein [Anaerolineales bacterium]
MEMPTYQPTNLQKHDKFQIFLWRAKRFVNNVAWPLVWRNLFLLGIGLTLVYLTFNLQHSARWINQPFAGFLHQNQVVIESNLVLSNRAEALPEGFINKGEIISHLDGHPVPSSNWLIDYARQHQGQKITYTLLRPNETSATIELRVLEFTWPNFIQMVAVPGILSLFILVTAATIMYLGYELFLAKLFTLFSIALALHLGSFPGFATGYLADLTLSLALIARIVLPSLFLHLLLLLYQPQKLLAERPFLLPLIYLPILPGLVHLPQIFGQPIAHRDLVAIIEMYTLIYSGIGLIILLEMMRRNTMRRFRKRAGVLLLGLTGPLLILLISLLLNPTTHIQIFMSLLNRYSLVGLPFAVVWLAIRYEDFGFKVAQRSYFLYLRLLLVGLLGYVCLMVVISPTMTSLDLLQIQDIPIILIGVALVFVVRLLYNNLHNIVSDWFFGSVDEFKVGYRIISHNLPKVETRRDLERVIGLDVPSDFRLRNAEITSPEKKSNIRYLLAYPLTVNNLAVGNLYLGGKINGKSFTDKELEIIDELKKQISLALWSFELDETIHKVEELTRLKSRFLAHVTHELRTPLNGIINYIGFVLDDFRSNLNPEQVDHLERALSSAERLLHIINNILDMSKIEAGQMNLNRQPVNLAKLVSDLTPVIQHEIQSKPVELITDVAANVPEISGDYLRIRQIILNLLFNAAKFTQSGSIYLRVRPEAGTVVITVADTGPGIDDQLKGTIFQKFMSAGLTDVDQNLGPGLSMPITKALVELHGGRIDLTSRPGQGTIFVVTLPVDLGEPVNGYIK